MKNKNKNRVPEPLDESLRVLAPTSQQGSIFDHVQVKKSLGNGDFCFDMPAAVAAVSGKNHKSDTKKDRISQVPTNDTTKQRAQVKARAVGILGKYGFDVVSDQKSSIQKRVERASKFQKIEKDVKVEILKNRGKSKKRQINQLDIKSTKGQKKRKFSEQSTIKMAARLVEQAEETVNVVAKKTKTLGLSGSTLAILKNLKNPKKKTQDIQIEDIPFSSSNEVSLEADGIKAAPVKFSEQTAQIISEIRSKNTKSPQTRPIQNFGLSASEIHKDLLQVSRKLVMPAPYRALLDMSKYIDVALNFLKNRKTTVGTPAGISSFTAEDKYICIEDVKKSIALTQRKNFTLKMFRQILSIVPDLYDYKWLDEKLCINFCGAKQVINYIECNQRQALMEKNLIVMAIKEYKKWLTEQRRSGQVIADVFDDPVKIQMWHHSYQPHEVEEVPMAYMESAPATVGVAHKSLSVKDFIKTNEKKSFITDAIAITTVKEQSHQEEDSKLKKLSLKTGISISTLKLIQQKKSEQETHTATSKPTATSIADSNASQLTKLSQILSQQFDMKKSYVIQELISRIQKGQSHAGVFKSYDAVKGQIYWLAKLVPEFVAIKKVGSVIYVKCVGGKMSSWDVGRYIRERISQNQNQQV